MTLPTHLTNFDGLLNLIVGQIVREIESGDAFEYGDQATWGCDHAPVDPKAASLSIRAPT
jgi:hypothetical protein